MTAEDIFVYISVTPPRLKKPIVGPRLRERVQTAAKFVCTYLLTHREFHNCRSWYVGCVTEHCATIWTLTPSVNGLAGKVYVKHNNHKGFNFTLLTRISLIYGKSYVEPKLIASGMQLEKIIKKQYVNLINELIWRRDFIRTQKQGNNCTYRKRLKCCPLKHSGYNLLWYSWTLCFCHRVYLGVSYDAENKKRFFP
jgi:hypothetical protein